MMLLLGFLIVVDVLNENDINLVKNYTTTTRHPEFKILITEAIRNPDATFVTSTSMFVPDLIKVQLKPLTDHLSMRIKDLEVPDYETLHAWEHASVVARASNSDPNAIDTTLNGQGGLPNPFVEDIKVVEAENPSFHIDQLKVLFLAPADDRLNSSDSPSWERLCYGVHASLAY